VQFENAFGAPISSAAELTANKTLTIGKLMDLMPAGTTDPTPYLYDSTMYTMAGLMGVAAISHAFVRPVNQKYYEPLEPEATPRPSAAGSTTGPPAAAAPQYATRRPRPSPIGSGEAR
jgi:hypothetical protein